MVLEDIHETLKTFNTCAPVFIALSDTYRQQLIFDIIEAGKDGINVTNLSSKSHLSRPAISHHLKVLKDSGLVIPKKIGTQIFYQLNLDDKFETLLKLINSTQKLMEKIKEAENEEESKEK